MKIKKDSQLKLGAEMVIKYILTQNLGLHPPSASDPAVYLHGRKTTLAGSVLAKEVRPLGEIEYSDPVIEKKELYLWSAEEYSKVRFGVPIGTAF